MFIKFIKCSSESTCTFSNRCSYKCFTQLQKKSYKLYKFSSIAHKNVHKDVHIISHVHLNLNITAHINIPFEVDMNLKLKLKKKKVKVKIEKKKLKKGYNVPGFQMPEMNDPFYTTPEFLGIAFG